MYAIMKYENLWYIRIIHTKLSLLTYKHDGMHALFLTILPN
jgi:hypothetical protein